MYSHCSWFKVVATEFSPGDCGGVETDRIKTQQIVLTDVHLSWFFHPRARVKTGTVVVYTLSSSSLSSLSACTCTYIFKVTVHDNHGDHHSGIINPGIISQKYYIRCIKSVMYVWELRHIRLPWTSAIGTRFQSPKHKKIMKKFTKSHPRQWYE